MSDITEVVATLSEKQEGYAKAEAYYSGDVDEVFASGSLRRALRDTGDFRTNFCSVVITAVKDRLELAGFSATEDDATVEIGTVWENNELNLEADEIHESALVYGDAYATVWPDLAGELQVYYNNPRSTIVLYDPENPRVKRLAGKMWALKEDGVVFHRLNLYYPDRVEKYIMRGERASSEPGQWSEYAEPVENPWGEVPVFHFRTKRQYGRPEHFGAYGAQDAINKLVITEMSTVDYQGAPQRYALAGNQQTNEITDFDDGAVDRENIGSLQNGPGELWYLKGIDQVGQFDPADPKAFIEPMREFIKSIATTTSTPMHYFEKSSYIPSGEALRVAESPLSKKVLARKLSFGSTWRDLLRFAMRVQGYDVDVQVKWQDHESTDEGTDWDIASKKLKAGLPLKQVLTEMGYDKDLVDVWIREGAKPLIPGITPEWFEDRESTTLEDNTPTSL